MSSVFYPAARRRFAIPILLGAWVAAIVAAPDLTAKLALAAPAVLVPLALWTLESPGRWIAGFVAAALLLPPLPIALGDSGPHLCLLFAGLGLLAGLIGAGSWHAPATALNYALAALLVLLLASVAPAALHSGGAVAAGSLARVALFAIAVYAFFFTAYGPGAASASFSALPWLYWTAAASALFACVDFYFQFPAPAGYEQQFIWLDSGVYRRAQGLFYEASTLGNLCAFFLEMIAVALFRPRKDQPFSRLELSAGGGALAVALILSFSRASLVNLAVAMTILLWLNRERIHWRRMLISAGLVGAAAGAILTAAFPAFTGMAWLRLLNAFQYFFESPNAVLSGRIQSWQTLWAFLASNPWHALLGVGYKTLPYSDFIGTTAVGDNTYLTLLLETGILGLAAVIALNCTIIVYAHRAARSASSLGSFCGTWMLCFWAGQIAQMFSADLLTYWRVLPVYFFVLALAMRQERV